MTVPDESDRRFGHARLASTEPDGQIIREAVPVRFLDDDEVEVLGSPGYVIGCAAGDVVRVMPDRFEMVRVGPNICVQAFSDQPFSPESLDGLGTQFAPLGGFVEAPAHRKFVVVTVPRSAGLPAIEAVMAQFAQRHPGIEWHIANPSG